MSGWISAITDFNSSKSILSLLSVLHFVKRSVGL
jgi:hypothetical protein